MLMPKPLPLWLLKKQPWVQFSSGSLLYLLIVIMNGNTDRVLFLSVLLHSYPILLITWVI